MMTRQVAWALKRNKKEQEGTRRNKEEQDEQDEQFVIHHAIEAAVAYDCDVIKYNLSQDKLKFPDDDKTSSMSTEEEQEGTRMNKTNKTNNLWYTMQYK
jgi:hypothetical protein